MHAGQSDYLGQQRYRSRRVHAGPWADRIVLPPRSPVSLREANNRVYGPTGLSVIRSQITIAGNGSTIRRVQSAPNFRILAVGDTGDLTLQRTVAVAYF